MKNLIITTILLLANLLPIFAIAHDIRVGGIYYNINGNEATVTYHGNQDSGYYYDIDVVIPESISYGGKSYTVTAIDDYAFSFSNLRSIELPNTIRSIGDFAFGGNDFTSIIIPNSVTYIGDGAFDYCNDLEDIVFSSSLTYTHIKAFRYTKWYDNQPDGLVYAGPIALSYKGTMPSYTHIELKEGTLGIACEAFRDCSGLTSIEIPNSVICVGSDAFDGTAWYENQPDGMVYINDIAYSYKGTLPEDDKSIILRDGIKSIADFAFYNCHDELTSVAIPSSVIYIGKWAFTDCSGLTNIEIPNSVASIGDYAFYGCTGLTSIEIPNSVASIGKSAFYCCTGLTSLTIPNSVSSIGASAFMDCDKLSFISLGDSITSIPGFAFSGCRKLTNINIPNSVIFIGSNAFSDCTELANINIGNSVAAIGRGAFSNTPWDNNLQNGLIYAGSVAYKYKGTMPNGTSIRLEEGTLGIADGAFSGCGGLTNIEIPNTVKHIGENAFSGCTSLERITIPNSVSVINNSAFYGCSSLTSMIIPNSVTAIGMEAFCNCTRLRNIAIPNSVTYIDMYAFEHCNSITSLEIGKSVAFIGDGAFYGSSGQLYCYAITPPECYNFDNEWIFSDYSATLHVPASSLAAYFTAPVWSNFENIIGDAVPPTGISISEDSVEIQLGEQIELTATVKPENASIKDVTWYSTDETVATVENGTITTIGVGECDIIAIRLGMQSICHVSVFNKISMEQEEAMLLPNHMLTLTPTAPVMPEGFTVTSSEPTVAAARVVNGKVQVVGIKEGTTIIMVRSADGTAVPATCLVTVYTEPGDVNMDGFVNISDVTVLIDYLLGSVLENIKEANGDLNGDGSINIADVTALIDILLSSNND